MEAIIPFIADGLVLLGLTVLTISVYGLLRMRDVFTRLHATGTAGVMGALPILVAVTLGSGPTGAPKALLVMLFLVLTAPVVAHEVGRAAYLERERVSTPAAQDSSEARLESTTAAPD